ncbi:MAG: hypothetical protein AAB880_02590 [Patescibacteria group bacterium]
MRKIKLLTILLTITFLGAACTPGNLGVTDDAGAWLSLNRGENWQQKVLVFADHVSRKTMADIDIHQLVFSPQDNRKIFALSREGGLWMTWNAGNNWDLILPSSAVNDLAITPNNGKIYYVATGPSIAKTENEGDIFKAVYTSDQKTNEITSLALHPKNTNLLYAGTSSGEILVSENAGVSWRVVTKLSGIIRRLAIHPNAPDIMYAAVGNTGLARSTDNAKNWDYFTEAFKEYNGANDYRDFVLVPSGIVYASRYGLLRSLNQGRDWTNLPLLSSEGNSNIYALAVNMNNPLELYYGTRSTFYRSVDGGFNWIPRNLPSTRAATAILISPDSADKIYLGVSRIR